MAERGFKYDRLTEADDASVEHVRERIYACPCGAGPWVSIKTGEMHFGNGGSEREQEWLYRRGRGHPAPASGGSVEGEPCGA